MIMAVMMAMIMVVSAVVMRVMVGVTVTMVMRVIVGLRFGSERCMRRRHRQPGALACGA